MTRPSTRVRAAAAGVAALVAWITLGAVAAVLATTSAAQAAPLTAPAAATADVTDLTDATATLHGTVTPVEPTASTWFEWGFTAAYGRTTPPVDLNGGGEQAVTATLGSLVPATTYHYRLVAANGTGTTRTPDAVFTTPARVSTSTGVAPAGGAAAEDAPSSSPGPVSTLLASVTLGSGGASGTTVSTTRVAKPAIRLPVTCASGPTCSGSVAIVVPRRVTTTDARTSVAIATASFTIPSGTRVTLKMSITRGARTLIAQAKRAGQLATAQVLLDGQTMTSRRVTLATQPRRPG